MHIFFKFTEKASAEDASKIVLYCVGAKDQTNSLGGFLFGHEDAETVPSPGSGG